MIDTVFLSSEETINGFTVRMFLQEHADGMWEIRSAYTRNGRPVAYYKGRDEVGACNKARWELVRYLESLGWSRDTSFSSGIGNVTGDVVERWIAPGKLDFGGVYDEPLYSAEDVVGGWGDMSEEDIQYQIRYGR